MEREPRQPVVCREALDLVEGSALLVDARELQGFPAARVPGLPEGFVARRLRNDCVLIGYQHVLGTMALKLNTCTLKERHREFLEGQRPPEIKDLPDESSVS